ncbi:MAG: metal ABC transporter ATP-binding protein [Deltaproteobacteria bacterium]|nr:metal ABC transporter ATP-binding protein [Deltaproteobacteria bacterium]
MPMADEEKKAAEPAVLFESVTVSYMNNPALRDVTVALPAGRLTSVTGPNGAGKTTFLRALLGLMPLDSGRVLVFGQPVDAVRKNLAYVPQTESVDWDFPITARDVVMMGRYPHLRMLRRPHERDHHAVDRALERVVMKEYADRHIRQLSGGQQQRIFIARALAQEADMLILDEPFTGIDARTEETLLDLITKLSREGKTLVIVNHDLSLLDRFDFVLLLNRTVVAAGPPDEAATPAMIRRAYSGALAHADYAERLIHEGDINEFR